MKNENSKPTVSYQEGKKPAPSLDVLYKMIDNYDDRRKHFDTFIKTTEQYLMRHFGIDMTREKEDLTEKFLDSELDELMKKKDFDAKKILRKLHQKKGKRLVNQDLRNVGKEYGLSYDSLRGSYFYGKNKEKPWANIFEDELKKAKLK